MQLILHYDETYREVKYGNMGLPDIDSKMLMGINVTPIAALLYTPVLIRCQTSVSAPPPDFVGYRDCWIIRPPAALLFWTEANCREALLVWKSEKEKGKSQL
jgi:hypothetical protein